MTILFIMDNWFKIGNHHNILFKALLDSLIKFDGEVLKASDTLNITESGFNKS